MSTKNWDWFAKIGLWLFTVECVYWSVGNWQMVILYHTWCWKDVVTEFFGFWLSFFSNKDSSSCQKNYFNHIVFDAVICCKINWFIATVVYKTDLRIQSYEQLKEPWRKPQVEHKHGAVARPSARVYIILLIHLHNIT